MLNRFLFGVVAWGCFLSGRHVLAGAEFDTGGAPSLPPMFDRLVVPGVRIGPLELGASETAVVAMLGQPESEESPFPGTRLLAWRNLGLDVAFARGGAVRIRAIGPDWRCADLSLTTTLTSWVDRFPDLRDERGLLLSPTLGMGLEVERGESVARAVWVMAPRGNWSSLTQDQPPSGR